jgi:hypothetical protein
MAARMSRLRRSRSTSSAIGLVTVSLSAGRIAEVLDELDGTSAMTERLD